jgi:hypothetical protein
MADILVQIAYEADSALPEDVSVNTLHFTGANDVASLNGLLTAINTNWVQATDNYLSATLSGNVVLKAYDLGDAIPRVPITQLAVTCIPSATSFPREVALCVSYRAAQVSGANMRRRRGRLYFGPLGTGGFTITDSDYRPNSVIIGDLLNAFEAMFDAATALGYTPVVWSETDGVGRAMVAAWIDNAADTQRRRGRRATARTNRTLV